MKRSVKYIITDAANRLHTSRLLLPGRPAAQESRRIPPVADLVLVRRIAYRVGFSPRPSFLRRARLRVYQFRSTVAHRARTKPSRLGSGRQAGRVLLARPGVQLDEERPRARTSRIRLAFSHSIVGFRLCCFNCGIAPFQTCSANLEHRRTSLASYSPQCIVSSTRLTNRSSQPLIG